MITLNYLLFFFKLAMATIFVVAIVLYIQKLFDEFDELD